MSMDVNAVSSQYTQYYTAAKKTQSKDAKTQNAQQTGATLELSSSGMKAYEEKMKSGEGVVISAATQEKVAEGEVKAEQAQENIASGIDKENPYAITKWTEEDRAALVKELQANQAQLQSNLINMVREMFGQQANIASGDESSIWKFLASGDFEVDAETKASAQEAVSEDGFYGVKQTSERLFQFAMALAGDDVDKMKKMQDAIQTGYEQAEKMWGKELPEISKNTMNAVNDLFSGYYESKGEATE